MSASQAEMLLSELDGRKFRSYRELEESVVELFNRHIAEFPPFYSYRQLIRWGTMHDLIFETPHGTYVVQLKHHQRDDY